MFFIDDKNYSYGRCIFLILPKMVFPIFVKPKTDHPVDPEKPGMAWVELEDGTVRRETFDRPPTPTPPVAKTRFSEQNCSRPHFPKGHLEQISPYNAHSAPAGVAAGTGEETKQTGGSTKWTTALHVQTTLVHQ